MPLDDPYEIYRQNSPYRSSHQRHKDAIKAIRDRDRDKATFARELATEHQAERIKDRVDAVLYARKKLKQDPSKLNQTDVFAILSEFVDDISYLDPCTQKPRFRDLLLKAKEGILDRAELDREAVAIFSQVVPQSWLENQGMALGMQPVPYTVQKEAPGISPGEFHL